MLYKATRSFFANQRTTKNQRMWTCFKRDKKYFKDPKQKKKDGSQKDCSYLSPRKNFWVPCSTRATNKLGKRTHIGYLVNRFPPPEYSHFFSSKGIKFDGEGFALSEMIQFIWRSAIRNNKEIVLYIPSQRMKRLLKNYLNGKNFGKEFSPPTPFEIRISKDLLFNFPKDQ